MKVAIIDYGLGNIFSVAQACREFGTDAILTSDKKILSDVHGIILPGVGAFGQAMKNLKEIGLDDELKNRVKAGVPLMGICLGLQLLFESSEEFGAHHGLGLIPGTVKKFPEIDRQGNKLRVPNIGWHRVRAQRSWEGTPMKNVAEGEFMYFVHSFYGQPARLESVLAVSEFGGDSFACAVQSENVFATQFHPEKSGRKGLEIYKTWLSGLR